MVDPSYALCWLRSHCSRRKKTKDSGLTQCMIQSTRETCNITITRLSMLRLDRHFKFWDHPGIYPRMTQTAKFDTRVPYSRAHLVYPTKHTSGTFSHEVPRSPVRQEGASTAVPFGYARQLLLYPDAVMLSACSISILSHRSTLMHFNRSFTLMLST